MPCRHEKVITVLKKFFAQDKIPDTFPDWLRSHGMNDYMLAFGGSLDNSVDIAAGINKARELMVEKQQELKTCSAKASVMQQVVSSWLKRSHSSPATHETKASDASQPDEEQAAATTVAVLPTAQHF